MTDKAHPIPDNETNQPSDGTSRSITGCLPKRPMVVANRLISRLSRHPRTSTAERHYTTSNNGNEKASLTVESLSNQTTTTRIRSSSSHSPPSSFRATSLSPNLNDSSSVLHNSTTTPSDLNKMSTNTTRVTIPDMVDYEYNFNVTYSKLRQLVDTNCKYFSQQKNDICRRFERLLLQLSNSIEFSMPLIRYLQDNIHHFDYSSEIKANGYRTLVIAHGHACARTLDILRQLDTKRVGLLFNLMYSSRLFQDLESWTKALAAMQRMLQLAVKMVDYSEKKVLCVNADHVPLDVELDYYKMVAFDSQYFFGRTCGFQFASSMQTMLTFLLAGLATFHEAYNRPMPYAAAGLATAPKYIVFPEQRAKKCAAIFRDCDYLFCKSFWNLVDHDYVKMGSRYIVPNVTVSKYFEIGPEDIEIDSINISPPSITSNIDGTKERQDNTDNTNTLNNKPIKQVVNIKLLSHEVREGMSELPLKKNDLEIPSTKTLPPSDHLILHIHGGGFIATSSTTHEVYLKPWALSLEVPIVSVDYSLAPEYPFPYAIEECFYTYAWILRNASKLGWNGKVLLLIGDSAGGNLVTTVTMKAIEAGLRKPDAIVCFYTPFLLGYSMSPSRLMAIMDPLLNTGFLWRCLAAYAGIKSDDESKHVGLDSTAVSSQINNTREQKCKADNTSMKSPGQTAFKTDQTDANEQTFKSSEYVREDTYYTSLANIMGVQQARLLRKLRESTLPNNPYMSPLLASDDILRQFPTTYLVACHQDPLLDDSITFARHLRSLSVEHHLVVVQNVTHGFLNFYHANNDCKKAAEYIMNDFARRYDIHGPLFSSKKKKHRKKKSTSSLTSPTIIPMSTATDITNE